MTISITSATGANSLSSTGRTTTAKTGAKTGFDTLIDQLMKEATKTPMERARDQVLKQNDLSEEQYAALPPEKRAAIDQQIAQAVRRVAEQQMAANRM